MSTSLIIPIPSQRSTKLSQEVCRPIVTGQCAQVLTIIRQHGPVLSFVLTADFAIPEAAARVHDLRRKGFNIVSTIVPEVVFRGQIRKRAALYSLGSPEWRPADAL